MVTAHVSDSGILPARVLLVDDHPIVRLGIRQMVGEDPALSICGEAESAAAALRLVGSVRADIAIVDLSLKDGGGMELIRAMRKAAPELLVLVLSMHDETLFAERALKAGAHGYIMKQEAIEGLVGAIKHVLSGRVFVSDRISQQILRRLSQHGGEGEPGSPLGALTDRELEVFELIGRGLSGSAIAESLGVSLKTIETYRAHIKTKMELKGGSDLIRLAASWTERL